MPSQDQDYITKIFSSNQFLAVGKPHWHFMHLTILLTLYSNVNKTVKPPTHPLTNTSSHWYKVLCTKPIITTELNIVSQPLAKSCHIVTHRKCLSANFLYLTWYILFKSSLFVHFIIPECQRHLHKMFLQRSVSHN